MRRKWFRGNGVLLVDSSVWVFFPDVADLLPLVEDEEIVTCLPVVEEVLRGARSERQYREWRITFSAMTMIEEPMPFEVFEDAAVLYRIARANGYTIRSPYDCLIAACAIRNGASVLHMDRDFESIARVSRLQQRNLRN
jgi:predicted nucleic acid-binding protein